MIIRKFPLYLFAGIAILLLALISSCSTTPIVCGKTEPAGACVADVPSIGQSMKGRKQLVVFFIHGVGDHCPGFALDGWLNEKRLDRRHLVVDTSYTETSVPYKIPLDGGDENHIAGQITVSTKAYRYDAGGTNIELFAVEITWSQLTQWLKNRFLDYDSTAVQPTAQPEHEKSPLESESSCPDEHIEATRLPPSRVKINKMIKEGTLDRNLSDAIFYVGPFGRTMRYGVAEGICWGLVTSFEFFKQSYSRPDGFDPMRCSWPTGAEIASAGATTSYAFVTHSLGSLILFNIMSRVDGPEYSQLSGDEMAASKLACYTPAIYMMANQIAILQFASSDLVDYVSQHPYSPKAVTNGVESENRDTVLSLLFDRSDLGVLNNPYICGSDTPRGSEQLVLQAFSDTNDLLSWPFPPYIETFNTNVSDAYVQNSFRWFNFFEDPEAAHDDYFYKDDVWNIILCGVKDGRIDTACGRQ